MEIENDEERLNKLSELSDDEYSPWLHPDEDAWRQARSGSIGASDAAAVMGISPWKTEAQLWDEKANGKTLDFHNSDTVRGHRSEIHILELYGIETGRKIFSGERIMLTSKRNPFMSCTLDGIHAAAASVGRDRMERGSASRSVHSQRRMGECVRADVSCQA